MSTAAWGHQGCVYSHSVFSCKEMQVSLGPGQCCYITGLPLAFYNRLVSVCVLTLFPVCEDIFQMIAVIDYGVNCCIGKEAAVCCGVAHSYFLRSSLSGLLQSQHHNSIVLAYCHRPNEASLNNSCILSAHCLCNPGRERLSQVAQVYFTLHWAD